MYTTPTEKAVQALIAFDAGNAADGLESWRPDHVGPAPIAAAVRDRYETEAGRIVVVLEALGLVPDPVADSDRAFRAACVGPRTVGGRYRSGYWGEEYQVLAIDDHDTCCWWRWSITVATSDGRTLTHGTPWDPRTDRVITQPPEDTAGVATSGGTAERKDLR